MECMSSKWRNLRIAYVFKGGGSKSYFFGERIVLVIMNLEYFRRISWIGKRTRTNFTLY